MKPQIPTATTKYSITNSISVSFSMSAASYSRLLNTSKRYNLGATLIFTTSRM
jgi:hypothetical protein